MAHGNWQPRVDDLQFAWRESRTVGTKRDEHAHAERTNVHLGLLSLLALRVHWFVFRFLPQTFARLFQFLRYLLRGRELLPLRFFAVLFREKIVQISHAAITGRGARAIISTGKLSPREHEGRT